MSKPIDPDDAMDADFRIGDEFHGYRVEKITRLSEINAVLCQLRHLNTGSRHVHISRDDAENTFGVVFKTVPTDSTGVAHILEHTVLCGSKKFPVRDPFFSMLKRSLSTFMNAFTASDWTMYPFSTQNTKDFYNLMDVYLDAAFFPKLEELSFKQEGYRVEFDLSDGGGQKAPLVYKGVVYNEMKGAMSSPDQVMGRSLLNALYPDTTYSHNSGGAPENIPELTHAQLIAFHQRHYHPSNAYFYTYGNLPLKSHLEFIAERVMKHFEAIDPKTEVQPQPRWETPRTLGYTYPLAPTENPEHKSQACVAWLTGDVCDTFDVLVLSILEQILLGNAGSPLRKALMDSGLGSALCDVTGFDADNRDTLIACGLKDVNEASAEKIEALVLEVLDRLVKDKIEPDLIRSAIHQIEFHRKEVTNAPYPYGLKLLLNITSSWLHGENPERILQLDADFKRLHDEIDRGPFLEAAIQRSLLDNPHRVRMVLVPDLEKNQKEEQRVRKELELRSQSLSSADRSAIETDAVRLKKLQETPEDIGCLPTLALSDIPPQIQIHRPDSMISDLALWTYTQPTSGIFYFNATAGAADLPEPLLIWAPFFSYVFSRIGTVKDDYSQMARRIDAATGGFSMAASARMHYDHSPECQPMLALNAKCLPRNLESMISIVEDLIEGADFNDHDRLKQLLGEYVSGLESMIVQNGHRLAISLSARTSSPASALSEAWSGIHQIRTAREFNRNLDHQKLKLLSETLMDIAAAVFRPKNLAMAVVGEPHPIHQAKQLFSRSKTLGRFERVAETPALPRKDYPLEQELPYEGWSVSSAVAFVAQTSKTVPIAHADAPALAVLSKALRSLYLHREIREKGGAYGGFALYNPEIGLFSLASYRDPHVVRTMDVFSGIGDFLRTDALSDEDVKEAILQVCSEIDKPDPPGPAARKAFARLIVGLTDDVRRAFKNNLLQVTKDHLIDVAESYTIGIRDASGVAVIAGQPLLESANQELNDKPLPLRSV